MAERILMNEFKTLSREKWAKVELNSENILHWDVALMVLNLDSLYYGGYFRAKMIFPKNYPYSPPSFRFRRPLFHPNIYEDGKVCISILHPPGEDEMSGETAAERWSPAQRVESVLLSIISLLDDAECSSPANVDAGVMLRKNPEEYRKRVLQDVETSKSDIPAGFIIPKADVLQPPPQEKHDDKDFWYDSGEEDDFGGSATDDQEENDFGDDGEEEEEVHDSEDAQDEMDVAR